MYVYPVCVEVMVNSQRIRKVVMFGVVLIQCMIVFRWVCWLKMEWYQIRQFGWMQVSVKYMIYKRWDIYSYGCANQYTSTNINICILISFHTSFADLCRSMADWILVWTWATYRRAWISSTQSRTAAQKSSCIWCISWPVDVDWVGGIHVFKGGYSFEYWEWVLSTAY